MATVNEVITNLQEHAERKVHVAVWTPLTTTDDVGRAVKMAGSADRSVQVDGTFGAGGTLRIEGSNDGVSFYVLTDPQGNALDFIAAGIEAVSEPVRFIRPRVTAGDGTTSLSVTMLLRRN
jgi:hypothetical protein